MKKEIIKNLFIYLAKIMYSRSVKKNFATLYLGLEPPGHLGLWEGNNWCCLPCCHRIKWTWVVAEIFILNFFPKRSFPLNQHIILHNIIYPCIWYIIYICVIWVLLRLPNSSKMRLKTTDCSWSLGSRGTFSFFIF